MDKPLLSVVVPVFNEVEGIAAFYRRMKAVDESLPDLSHETIFVDDGSTDGSYDRIVELAAADPGVRVVRFSRNFGHQVAITAGIEAAQGDAVVVIDADLQDPPETIRDFVAKWRAGHDVVYGIRDKRDGESRMKLWTAGAFYRILKHLVHLDIPVDVGDFRLMSRRVVDHFRALHEKDRFVRGMVSWIGFKQVGVHYRRDKRHAGATKYPYRKMIKFALDGITSFSDVPLRMVTWLGYGASMLALLYLCSVFIQKALGYTVQGWATIMVALLFLGGVQLISLGIIGEYIGRIFHEVKQRPLYVVDHVWRGGTGKASPAPPQGEARPSEPGLGAVRSFEVRGGR